MAARKPLVRIFPTETSFVGGLFTKGLGGYNWQFDTKFGYLLRRPGLTQFIEPIDEFVVSGMRYVFSAGYAADARNGIRGLFSYRRPYLPAQYGITTTRFILRPDSVSGILDGLRNPVQTVGIGLFPWQILPIRAAKVTAPSVLRVYDAAGIKTVSISSADGSIAAISMSADNPISALVSASSGLLVANGGGLGGEKTSMLNMPYQNTRFETKDYVEVQRAFPLPTTQFYNSIILYVGSAIPATLDCDVSPPTAVQLGAFLYIAGNGAPLLRYDGSRLHAAGAAPLDVSAPGALSLGGTGITGTFKYKILHRVYAPDGTHTDGLAYDLGSITPANQTVTVTVSLSSTSSNLIAAPAWSIDATGGITRYTLPTYKFTRFSFTGFTAGSNFIVSGTTLPAQLWPGDPLFSWDGATLTKSCVTTLYADGSVETSVPTNVANTYSAGDVYVLLRTVSGGTSVYYELTEIPTGVTSFADATSDATLLTKTQYLDTAYLRNPPPNSTTAVCAHQQRLVVAYRAYSSKDLIGSVSGITANKATTLVWSEPFTEHFPPANSIDLSSVCSQIIAVASMNDTLYIFTDTGVSYIQGKLVDPTMFTFGRLAGSYVCASPASPVVTNDGIHFVTSAGDFVTVKGFQMTAEQNILPASGYQYDQAVGVLDSSGRRSYFFVPENVTGLRSNIPSTTGPAASLGQLFSSNISIPYGTNGICLVVDNVTNSYMIYTGMCASGGASVAGGLVTIADRDINSISHFRQLSDKAAGDLGRAIPVRVQTQFEDAESPHLSKTFSRLTTFSPDATSEFTLGVKVERDWDERRYIQDFTQSFRAGEGYANEAYATDPYGDGVMPDRVQDLNNFKAKALRLTFTHENAAENPIISGYALEYSDTTREGREE